MQENGSQISFYDFLVEAPQELNKNLQANLSLRMRFPTQTDKFYSSQQKINELLLTLESKLQETQDSPFDVLNRIINSKILTPLIKTFEHPNIDINIAAVNCFFSLTVEMNQDIEQMEKNQKQQNKSRQTFALFFRTNVWMIENGILQSLFAIMSKINQDSMQEYEGCRKILKILQFLLQLSDTVYPILIRDTTIIAFLANRIMPNFVISHKTIDDNKYIVSDILLALLQTPEVEQNLSAVRQFYKSCGVEVIVQTVSSYQNKLPTEIDEREYLMNLFDCLNVMLVSIKQTRQQFHSMKGCYLMVSYICTKSEYAVAALKAISNSLDLQADSEASIAICDQIINDGSLKYIFPILMMQGLKGKDDEQQQQINQHILRIIYYLVRNSEGVSKDRVVNKLTEKRFGKLQRIIQLRVQNQSGKEKKGELSAQDYIKMVSQQGLSLVQICDKIIATVWSANAKIRQKILVLLPLYNIKPEDLRVVIQRNYKFIDQGQQKQYLAKLLAINVMEMETGIVKK